MTDEQFVKPVKPNPDTLYRTIARLYEFAKDSGGERFLLPKAVHTEEPYIPQSFLTGDVTNLCHQVYRGMAVRWNAWVMALSEKERDEQKLKPVTEVPAEQTIRNAVSAMKSMCAREGRTVHASLRSIQTHDGIVIDLGDDTGKVAWVTAKGWEVLDPRKLPFEPPVFRRGALVEPLPEPVHDGNLNQLWEILHVESAETRALCTGWLSSVYFSEVSRPGIWATGPAGSGKTTLAGGIGRIANGLEWLDGRLDKNDERNNIIRAVENYVVSFDNMTSITADMSDWIATMVTGHRSTFREMRTNFSSISMSYKRTFVATGLSMPYGFQADALERIIEVPCTRIPDSKRVGDAAIRKALDAARGQLLGAVLDHVVLVLQWLPHIAPEQSGMGRMNEYMNILWALDKAYNGTAHVDAYRQSLERIQQDKAEGEPVINALMQFIKPGQVWEGPAKQLYAALNPYRPLTIIGKDFWPANAVQLRNKMTELDRAIAESGFAVDSIRTNAIRGVRITRR